MAVFEFMEVITETRAFKIEAENRTEAETRARTMEGAFDISDIKERGPSYTIIKVPALAPKEQE